MTAKEEKGDIEVTDFLTETAQLLARHVRVADIQGSRYRSVVEIR